MVGYFQYHPACVCVPETCEVAPGARSEHFLTIRTERDGDDTLMGTVIQWSCQMLAGIWIPNEDGIVGRRGRKLSSIRAKLRLPNRVLVLERPSQRAPVKAIPDSGRPITRSCDYLAPVRAESRDQNSVIMSQRRA